MTQSRYFPQQERLVSALDVAVVVGHRHDDGLVDHIGRVGVTLKQVGDGLGVQSGVLGADVGGLVLFCGVGGGNVVGTAGCRRGGSSSVSRPPSGGRLLGLQSGVFGLEMAVVGFEFTVAVFQVQDLRDPGDVDALGDELADPLQAIQIVVAVSASAAVGARRGEQSAPLVEPQGLRINPGQLRGHRDAVHAARRPRAGDPQALNCSIPPPTTSKIILAQN